MYKWSCRQVPPLCLADIRIVQKLYTCTAKLDASFPSVEVVVAVEVAGNFGNITQTQKKSPVEVEDPTGTPPKNKNWNTSFNHSIV